MVRLYVLETTEPSIFYGGITFTKVPTKWFIVGREDPVVPYSQGIADFETMSDREREYAATCFNEFFTAAEAEQALGYLRIGSTSHYGLEALCLPVQVSRPLQDIREVGYDYIDRWRDEGYALPFKLRGLPALLMALTISNTARRNGDSSPSFLMGRFH